jgi:uncharacterized PurR-regulated membrane protein YhhQ (DUF165 family)
MLKAKTRFLAGFVTGWGISLLFIHFILADLIAQLLGVRGPVVYWALIAALLLWGVVTIVRFVQGRDGLQQKFEAADQANGKS